MEPCAAWRRPGSGVFAGELRGEPGSGRGPGSAGEPPPSRPGVSSPWCFGGPSGSTCRACLCHQRRLGRRTTSPGVGRGARGSLQTLRSTGLTLVPLWPLRNSGVESVAQSGRAACRPDSQPHTGICSFLVSVSVCPGPVFFFNVDLFMWLHGTLLEARELLVAAGGD